MPTPETSTLTSATAALVKAKVKAAQRMGVTNLIIASMVQMNRF
jgi:hypothetical protein